MDYPFGIDISKYQYSSDGTRKPDFARINASCDFVAVRAGISWGYTDQWFAYSWGHLTIPRLAYHVVYPGENAERQMAHFLQIVKPGGHDRLVLDCELSHGYSRAAITNNLRQCLEYLKRETGRYPIIYSRASFINTFMNVSILPEVDWWLAHYKTSAPYPLYTAEKDPPPALPNGVATWLIHQTGEKGNGSEVGVVSRYVDTNRWNGTQAELEAYFGLGEDEPVTETKLFDATVTTTPPNRLRTRFTPAGLLRPEPDWLASGAVTPVYETSTGWYRTNVETWADAQWLRRLDVEQPATLLNIPPVSQRDTRWASEKLGYSNLTLGGYGCLVTGVAMTLNWYGKQTDPARLNADLKRVGGFTGANMYWNSVEGIYPGVKLGTSIDCYYEPAPLERIDALLAESVPVLVHVDFNLKTPEVEQHWVLIVGKNGSDYIINDPWTGERRRFRENYGDPARYIFRIRAYRREIK